MEPLERKVFLNEIRLQCDFALASFSRLISLTGPTEEPYFCESHSFLEHAAQASCVIWPSPKRLPPESKAAFKRRKPFIANRTKDLQRLLSLPENAADHPLGNRDLRNMLEHFDLQLDKFLHEKTPNFFTDLILKARISEIDVPLDRCLRALALEDLEYVFLGRKFHLEPLADALTKLRAVVDDAFKEKEIYL